MGPQVGYFMPQILIEQDLHGPDIDAAGAAFAGVSPFVLLGPRPGLRLVRHLGRPGHHRHLRRGAVRAGRLDAHVQSTHYRYKGQCRPMEILTRINEITPNPADPSPPETYTLTAQRTVHGIVHKRGTVGGKPVAFAKQRSTYFHEADSARGFSDLNRPSKVENVQDFQQAVSKIGFTFNWFYADDRDIGYFNSGDNPVRADGRRATRCPTGAPASGTGRASTRPTRPPLHAVRAAPAGDQPALPDLVEQQAGARLRGLRLQLGLRLRVPLAAARHAASSR